MKRRSNVFLAIPLFVCLLPTQVWGSIAPSSVGVSLGYTNDLSPEIAQWTPVPMVVATWRLGSHASIRSSAAYLQKRADRINRILPSTGYPPMSPGGDVEVRRDHFVPIAAGIRLSAGGGSARSHGLFVEASPAAYIARLNAGDDGPTTRLLAGFQLGWGLRVLAFDGTHVELGMIYYRSEAASRAHSSPTERSDGYPGVNAAEIHLTVGLGR